MAVIALICLYVTFTIGRLLHSQFIRRRFSSLSFQQLLSNLEPIRTEEMAGERFKYGSSGMEKIRRIQRNCSIMIALALYCDTWCPQCCTETVVAMRNHEMKVYKAAKRYRASMFFRMAKHQSLNYAEVGAEYCKLVQCLLDLYRKTHVARYPQLRAACG